MAGAIQAVSPYDYTSLNGNTNVPCGEQAAGAAEDEQQGNNAAFNLVGRDNNGAIIIFPPQDNQKPGEPERLPGTENCLQPKPPGDREIIKALLAIIMMLLKKEESQKPTERERFNPYVLAANQQPAFAQQEAVA